MPRSTARKPPETNLDLTVKSTERTAKQRSRIETVWIGGYFNRDVSHRVKKLAIDENTTVQALIGRALNDLLEKYGHGRPASEAVLPRGAAAHRQTTASESTTAPKADELSLGNAPVRSECKSSD